MPLKKMEEEPSYRLGVAISILEGILEMKEDPTLRGIPKKVWMDSGKKFLLEERARLSRVKDEDGKCPICHHSMWNHGTIGNSKGKCLVPFCYCQGKPEKKEGS